MSESQCKVKQEFQNPQGKRAPKFAVLWRTCRAVSSVNKHLFFERAFAYREPGRRGTCISAGIRSGRLAYHPAQSQGHIKAVTMARAVQNATHNQRFRLGVIDVASLTIRTV